MDGRLTGMTALVTGAGQDLCLLVVEALAVHGATVVAASAKQPLDVPHDSDVDILVDVTGSSDPKPFTKITDQDWRGIFENDVMPGIQVARHMMPRMLLRDRGCLIFVIGGFAAADPWKVIHHEAIAAARLSIAQSLASMATGTGVTVGAVLACEAGLAPVERGRHLISNRCAETTEEIVKSVLELVHALHPEP